MSAWLERLSNSHNLLLNVDVIKNWEGGWLAKPPTTIFAKFYITLTEELFFCFFSFLLVKVFDKPVAPPPPPPTHFQFASDTTDMYTFLWPNVFQSWIYGNENHTL